jgi:hypothetical protein
MAGFGDLEFMQRGRRLVVGIVMLGLGGVIGYAVPKSNAAPTAQTGTIKSVDNATTNAGILFKVKAHKVHGLQQFRWQDGTPWRDSKGHWHDKGRPDCLIPGSPAPAKITVGAVDVQAASDARARTVLVWVKCYG